MSLPALTVIPAGAGSGKTYTIQTQLGEWIKDGKIQPERIVAVTFTEAAAGELRERIRAELIRSGRPEDALKLDQAIITTIHGFGLRVLSEFCFEAGITPRPRLLSEDEEDALIRHALTATERADAVMDRLKPFGYGYDFATGKGPEDQFRDKVLAVIVLLRVIGRVAGDPLLWPYAEQHIRAGYGPTGDAGELHARLQGAVNTLRARFPQDLSVLFKDKKTVAAELRKNYRALYQAGTTDALSHDWALWQKLRNLRLSNSSSKLPEGYDALAEAVMLAAAGLTQHPGPLEDAIAHAGALFGAAEEALERHSSAKRGSGLLDYTDMLAESNRLFAGNAAVLRYFSDRWDCLVIDEFQDTNPLQFSLLWLLHRACVPALVVGDRKQAIMRFQQADARLLAALESHYPEAVTPLAENWRTTPVLMEWINAVGNGLFPGEYTPLRPQASYPSSMAPLDVVHIVARTKSSVVAEHMACHLKALLDSGELIYDRHSKRQRPLRGGDIAVLCPKHALLSQYAAALRAVGVRVRRDEEGWFKSPVIELAFHALAYVADPHDAHAALYLTTTELGVHDLESALTAFIDGAPPADPVLALLDAVHDVPATASVEQVVREVIAALDLYERTACWPDGAQARANLVRLQAEAKAFTDSSSEALASGGYYGSGLKTFLAWLRARAERDDNQPPARVIDEDAVHLVTWHSAKGREWPVVAVCGTYSSVKARLPDLDVQYASFDDLERVLPEARIAYTPGFDAPEACERFTGHLQWLAEDDATRLLYVALTRPREKLILEWPSYLEDKEGSSYWSVLKDKSGMTLQDDKLGVGDQALTCTVREVGKESPDVAMELPNGGMLLQPAVYRQLIQKQPLDARLTPESVSPSTLKGDTEVELSGVIQEKIAPAFDLDLEVSGAVRGDLLHRALEVLAGESARAALVTEATSYPFTTDQIAAITETMNGFEAWMKNTQGASDIGREVPLLALNENGSVVSGAIDVLARTGEGYWIIDYKSDATADYEARFRMYLPQLLAYAEALRQTGAAQPVCGIAIFWIITGEVSVMPLQRKL